METIPKTACEKMLDQEATRVAKSILQLVNSIKFGLPEDNEEGKAARSIYNKVAYTMKEVITNEIEKEFLS